MQNLFVHRDASPVLSDITFNIGDNLHVGIIGPNGAGKSTLLASLAGLLLPEAGTILLQDKPLAERSITERAQLISYLPQQRPVHWMMKVEDIVHLGRYAWGVGRGFFNTGQAVPSPQDLQAVETAINETQIHHLRHRSIETLSGGEQARVHLARAMAANTPILLADEPTRALDPGQQFNVMAMLQDYAHRRGIVITAIHDLALAARYCDVLLIIDKGRLIAHGPPDHCLTPALMQEVFQVDVQFISTENGNYLIMEPLKTA